MSSEDEAAHGSGVMPLRPDMTLRQIAMDYPKCRQVLERYGEPSNRPLPFGHLEPLTHFARRRGLPLRQLLAELSQAAGVPVDWDAPRAEHLHRPFVTSALVLTLTLGAGWGMFLLFPIAWGSSWQAVSPGMVVAHGATQLWGFVGLFVVGIALRYLPSVTGRTRAGYLLRHGLLLMFWLGVLGGFVWALFPSVAPWIGVASGLALTVAACCYLAFVVRQLALLPPPLWGWPVLASAIWMLLWAIAELVLRSYFRHTGPDHFRQSDRQLLMELALFGFALNAIYGFGQRLLPGMTGTRTPNWRAISVGVAVHNVGVLARGLAHLGFGNVAAWVGAGGLAAGGLLFVWAMHGYRRTRPTDPRPEIGPESLRYYVQLAFAWLVIAFLLLLTGETVWGVRGQAIPSAYQGAVRHALTVGFLTTLIAGVAQRLLPILDHRLLRWPGLVLPILALVGSGNVLRVGLEFATLASDAVFIWLPVSGILEVGGLVLFSVNVLATMWSSPEGEVRAGQITLRTSVAALLAEYPDLEDALFAWGVRYLGRVRSVPRELTLGSLCRSEGLDSAQMLQRIRDWLKNCSAM